MQFTVFTVNLFTLYTAAVNVDGMRTSFFDWSAVKK